MSMSDLPPNYGSPITLEVAKKIMSAAESEASRNNWPMVIAIVDSTGHLVMLHRMDQAQYGSSKIAPLKAETALDFRRSTKVFEDSIASGGQGVRIVTMPNVLALEGGLPILQDGKVIGAIGVSGMNSGQDAQVARAGIAALG
jgi:glc operon protein GlcG